MRTKLPSKALQIIESRTKRQSYLYHKDGSSSYRIQTDTLVSVKYKDDRGEIPLYESAVYKDFLNESMTYADMKNDSTTGCVTPIRSIGKWNQDGRQKIVAGYECHLMEKMNEYGVLEFIWYTEEIPIFDGPADYCNFPGLVMEVERGGKTFAAIKVEHNRKMKYDHMPSKIVNIINYTEFENRLKSITPHNCPKRIKK